MYNFILKPVLKQKPVHCLREKSCYWLFYVWHALTAADISDNSLQITIYNQLHLCFDRRDFFSLTLFSWQHDHKTFSFSYEYLVILVVQLQKVLNLIQFVDRS